MTLPFWLSHPTYILDKIRKVLSYVPILWKDHDFDYIYILLLLKHKLSHMRNRDWATSSADKSKHQLRICEILIDRIHADAYSDYAMAQHDARWGEAKYSTKPTANPGFVELVSSRSGVITLQDEEQQADEFLRIAKHGENMKRQDIRYLFSVMARNLQSWWD